MYVGKNQHQPYQPWSDREIDFLVENYSAFDNEQLSKKLFEISGINRTSSSIKAKAGKLKINKGCFWQKDEIEHLASLIGEYPFKTIVKKHQDWCRENKRRVRSLNQIKDRIKNQKDSIRLNCSSISLTQTDIKFFLGCDRKTVMILLKTYSKELNPKKDGKQTYVSKSTFRRFLLNHQDILERHQQKFDMRWLLYILRAQ